LRISPLGSTPLVVVGVLYFFARILGKYGGAYLGSVLTRRPKEVRNYLGLALIPQAGVAIGMATMVVAEFASTGDPAFAALGTQINTVVLCATLVYELLGPLITKWALTKAGEIHPDAQAEVVYDTHFVLPVDVVADKVSEKQTDGAPESAGTDGANESK